MEQWHKKTSIEKKQEHSSNHHTRGPGLSVLEARGGGMRDVGTGKPLGAPLEDGTRETLFARVRPLGG